MKLSQTVAALLASGLIFAGLSPAAAAPEPLAEPVANLAEEEFVGTDPLLDGELPVAGRSYVISLGGVLNPGGTGFESYANHVMLASGADGVLETTNQFSDTSETARDLPASALWVVEGSAGDYALHTPDGGDYLQLDESGASLGSERQALDIEGAGGDRLTITADIDGTTHHLDWDRAAAGFSTSTTGSSNSAFTIAEYRRGTEPISPIEAVPFGDLVDGETYVFAHLGIFSVGNSAGAVALSNETNGHPSPQLMRGDRFATVRDTAPDTMQWRAERLEDGWALQALSYPGQYLNVDSDGAYLGNKRAVELLEGPNGSVKISALSENGTRLYVRFTAANGGGWQAATADGSNTFTLFRAPLDGAHPLPPYTPDEGGAEPEPIDPELISKVPATQIEPGSNYILAIPGVTSSAKGAGTFALSSCDAESTPMMREHAAFNDPSSDLSYDMVWKIRELGTGYSLESPTLAGADRFLNIEPGELTMGPRQELDLTVEGEQVRVSRTVDGETYHVRFTNAGGSGWQSATPVTTSEFHLWEYTGEEYYTNGLVDSRAIVDGGEYAIILGGVVNSAGTGWDRYASYALSSDGSDVPGTLPAVGGIGADSRLGEDQYWIVQRFESGYSLRATGITGAPQYLAITGAGDDGGLALSTEPQVLALDRRENGLLGISSGAGAQTVAFQPRTSSFGVTTGATRDQISVWERRWSLEPLTTPQRIDVASIQNGQSYVLAAPNIWVLDQQFMTTAITGESNGNVNVGLMASAAFGLTDRGAPEHLQWRIAAHGDGYSMQSLAQPTADGYLNIAVVDGVAHARLGERQELDLVTAGSDVQITRVVDGTRYYLRYTAGNGGGWHAATASSSSTFRIYQTPIADVSPTLPLTKTDAADLDTEHSWAFVLDNAHEDGSPGALTGQQGAPGTLAAAEFFPQEDTIAPSQRWTLSPLGDGYAMLAEHDGGSQGFLNVGADGLGLGAAQELHLAVLEDGTVQIFGGDGAQEFAVGLVDGAWAAVAAADATALATYRINFPALHVPDEPTQRAEPDYTIAGFTDLHVDYGWQHREDPIRPTTREAAARVSTDEQPDLVLQGGDVISDNAGQPWSPEYWTNVTTQLEEMFAGIPESGQALHVNGNHDYEVGLTEWNSGAWIDDANQAATGAYLDVLYEGPERENNLAGYVAEVDGLKVIALSTPYNGDWAYGSYHYTLEQVEWFERQMAELDKNEFAITFTHYPLRDHRGGTGPGYGMSNDNGADDRIKAAMLPYPNVVHLYGHDHGANFVESDAWEKVTQYNSDGSVSQTRGHRTDSFTSVFLGSMSYYNNRYNPGWLTADNPAVVQPLLVYVYEDRIEFEYKNYGAQTGERHYPYTYTVPLADDLESGELDISGGTVAGIPHQTTAEQLGAYFDDGGQVVVRDFTGQVLAGDRPVRTDYTVQLVSAGGIVQDELVAVVDAAALPSHDWTVEELHLVDADGETTHALSEAAQVTGATLSAGSTAPPSGYVQVGIYGADGQYLSSATAPVSVAGETALTLDVSDVPDGATYRAYVIDGVATAQPLSEPLSSDGEKPLAAHIATSADTELVMGVDQAGNEIKVFHQGVANWDSAEALAWSWQPTDENGFAATRHTYTNVTDAKIRWSDYYDSYVVVTTASGGFVGLFDYATGEKLYESELRAENNPHSVEVLPDGNIVAASSHGNSVTIYAATAADPNGWHVTYELPDAHAVNWDPDMNVLWGAGSNIVQGYELTGTRAQPTLTARADMTHLMPEGGAHDLYVAHGVQDTYWLSGGENIFQFDARSGEFTTDIEDYDLLNEDGAVKGIGSQPFTGNVIRIHPNFDRFSWNSDSIRLFEKTPDGYVLDEKYFETGEFYKSRPWYPRYE